MLCFLSAGKTYARPSKEEKELRRASYWGLFADVYRARGCFDISSTKSDCATRALHDAASHVVGVDAAIDANEREFANEVSAIQKLVDLGKDKEASGRLETLRGQLISDFASNTAPVVQPSRDLGQRVFKEYCASCHGDGAGVDGKLTSKLRLKPPAFTVPARKFSQSPFGIYGVMIHGIDQSEMSSMLDVLSVDELWSVAFYISSLPHKELPSSEREAIASKVIPFSKEFSLSTLAISTDEDLRLGLIRIGLGCATCDKEISFLRTSWPWNIDSGRLGDVADTPRKKAEARALALLLLAIISVSGGFYFVLRRTGRIE